MAIVTEQVWTKADFVDLARRQKQFLGVILLSFLIGVVAVLVPAEQRSLARGVSTLVSLGSLYFVYRLVAAVLPPSGTWVIVAYFVLSFAGFLGATPSDLEKLPEDFTVLVAV